MKTMPLIIPILFCLALINVACVNTNTDSDSKTEVKNDVKTIPDTVDSIITSKPSSSTFLFDASGSMHGYLNSSADSRFLGVISQFENISTNTNIHLYGKDEGDPISRTDFDSMLNDGKIKWSNESNLKEMVQSMIKHINGGDDICFLLTDGILSGSNAQIKSSPERSYNIRMRQKMSEDLSSILSEKEGKLSALIVRYNAQFNGKYSCYNNDGKMLTNKDRPFFVIALGEWKFIKYIENMLNEAKSSNGITTPYEDIVMIGDMNSYKKIKLSPAEGLNPKDGVLIIKKEFRNKDTSSIKLSAYLEALPTYMQNDNYMDTNIELYVQRGQYAEKPLDKSKYSVSTKDVNGKNTLYLRINSCSLAQTKLTFRLKYALPQWVETMSDDNDIDIATNPKKLDKTFNLKYFIAGFTTLHKGKYIKEQTLEFK